MAYDSVRANKNIVLMPSSALESMNLGTTLGAAAFARRTREEDQYRDHPATDTSSSDGPEFRYGGRDQYRKPHGDANRGAKESGSSGQTKRDQPGGAHKPQRSSDKAQRSPSSDSTDDLPGGADQNQ